MHGTFRWTPQEYEPALRRAYELVLASIRLDGEALLDAGSGADDEDRADRPEKEEMPPWSFVREHDGIRVHTRSVPGSPFRMMRGEGDIEAGPEVVMAFHDMELKWACDSTFDGARQLLRPDERTVVTYSKAKAPWPVAPRDCLFAGRLYDLPGNARLIVSTSVAGDGMVADDPAYVRSIINFSAVYAQPSGHGRCSVTYILHVDPAGRVPAFIMNLVGTEQPLAIAKIRDLLAARPGLLDEVVERWRSMRLHTTVRNPGYGDVGVSGSELIGDGEGDEDEGDD